MPDQSVILNPAMPGWSDPAPSGGSYGITNILANHGRNALFMQAEPNGTYGLQHTRFATIEPTDLVSANVALDIFIGLDFSFDEDTFFAMIIDSAFPNCAGATADCFELIDSGRDARWSRNPMNAQNAVTRTDWSGFMLMLLVSENHVSDSSLGLVDNIDFQVCTRGAPPRPQRSRALSQADLTRLLEAAKASRQ